jgi:RNA polymerase sigma factor (sigma-70 family)
VNFIDDLIVTYIETCKGGRKMTEKELFDEFKSNIYRTCYYMLKNQQDAEDVTHEVFIKIFQADYHSIEKLKPWILSIAMNECRNFLKKHSRMVLFADFQLWTKGMKSEEETEDLFEKKELKKELIHFISLLSPKLKEVIILKYMHHQKNEEIASILDIPLGTVKSRANKGLLRLKKLIGEQKSPTFDREAME